MKMKTTAKEFVTFRNLPLFWKISFMPIFAVGLVMIGMFVYLLPVTKEKITDDKKEAVVSAVQMAYGLIAEYNQRAANGEFTVEEAKKRAHARIDTFQFGRDEGNYVWVNDSEKMLAHPRKDLEGKSLDFFKDANGKYFLREAVRIAAEKDDGFVEYYFPKTKDAKPSPKISYIRLFKPWGWYVGSGIYTDDVMGTVWKLLAGIFGILIFISVVVTITTFIIGGGFISRPVKDYGKMMQSFSSALSSGEGELTGRLNIKGTDEIGLLALDINKVLDAYGKMVEKRNHAEELLRRSENRLKDIIDFLPDTPFAVNLEGRVTTWNRAAEDYTGVKAEEILGRGDKEYSIPFYSLRRPMLVDVVLNPAEEVERLYSNVRRDGRVVVGEGYIHGAKHGEAYVLTRAVPLVDSNGNVIGAIESIRDITELKHKEENLRELSEKDPLTMIYNRRKLFDMLEVEVEKATRYCRPLSLLVLDLDYFKKVNDKYGHNIGDIVLKTTTQIVADVIRKVDIFARFGGEEFVIVCPETDIDGAISIANKIRTAVERHPYPMVGNITISIGAAEFSEMDSVNTFIKKADDVLYAAKKGGRNRVEACKSLDLNDCSQSLPL
jgi:diguanylate cyclase (GGDEF)-like protein/PAS domain S-box-containing protein